MSHWVSLKLKINDKDTLVKALKRMGATSVQVGEHSISQYGTTEVANVWIDEAVGFKQNADGTFNMIGDFYHSKDRKFKGYYNNTAKFEEELNCAYVLEDLSAKLDELGFEITENAEAVVGPDGLIRMEATCWL